MADKDRSGAAKLVSHGYSFEGGEKEQEGRSELSILVMAGFGFASWTHSATQQVVGSSIRCCRVHSLHVN